MEATATQTTIGPRAGSASLLDARFFASALLSAVLVAVLIGVPADVLPNPWFTRMTPATPANYLFWVASSMLTGVLLATFLLPRGGESGGGREVSGPAGDRDGDRQGSAPKG